MSTKSRWRHGRLVYFDSANIAELWPAAPAVTLYDDFIGADATDISTRTTGYTGSLPGTADALTIAVTADNCGTARLLSGTTDDEDGLAS